MQKLKYWGTAVGIGLLIGFVFWWAMSEVQDRKDPLNQSDAFVYSNNGILTWFELTSRRGKVEGILHQQTLIEESGEEPTVEEKKYPVTGKTTEKGYEFNVNKGGKIMSFNAWFSGPFLSIQMRGEKESTLYNAVEQKELGTYEIALENYQSEENEKNRLRKFFSELKSVYGYFYSTEDGSFQLFLKIEEALLQGELSGSLVMMTDTGNKKNPYEETRYDLNGITDGIMVEFFTTVDGKQTKLIGNFHGSAASFDLSFWTTDQKLSFQAVTEEEYNRSYEKYKTKVQ